MDKTTYHSVHASASDSHHVSGRGPRMRGRVGDILFAFSLMTIPMTLFSALLLGLIFYFRVTPSSAGSPDFQLPDASAHGNVIYVDISATTLTTVASWSSTVAPILVGCAITLISYPVAKQILRAGQSGGTDKLPTPFQLSLMLKMITSGSPQSLWNWIQYVWGWRGKKESQGKPMRLMTSILILALMLSTLVFAADTWFHFTTKTINLTQVYPITSALNTSVGLIPDCYNVNRTFQGGCTLNPAATATFLSQGPQAQSVVANLSTTMRVNTITSGKDVFTYVGNPPRSALANVDYQSRTWGLKTQCAPVYSQCAVPTSVGKWLDYKCPFAMEGRISTDSNAAFQNQFTMAYFTNSTGTSNSTGSVDMANPYYFASLAIVNQNIGHNPDLKSDPEISSTVHGADVFAVYCNTTVYDVKYTSINGSITRFDATPANSTLTNIIQGSQQYTRVGDPNLIQGAAIAALVSTDSQGVADYFALTYSQIALGIASAAFTPQAAIQAQRRETMLVAKVPIVPLSFLLISNLLLVLLGIVLLIFAAVAARGETREVQARLSVAGLVAAYFEGRRAERGAEKVEDLFEERENVGGSGPRVGVVQTAGGGWGFSVFRAG
ncbi:hypothetical protein BKA65DRAFT_21679 [Rhexocercosporidium sp. MPI-PUGE-AT-0058]|nr:hypothetical protein BKA65DRAFT_21679 [Rhexocercosporidium sp. MPI-PUGE-AT-0058]